VETNVLQAFEAASALYADMLGYAPGERITTPEDIARTVRAIAGRAPSRTRLEEYGRTFQGRPLHLLTVSAERNAERFDAIAEATRRLGERDAAAPDDLPATVWVMANVHGDETSTAEAALLVAIHLALCDEPAMADVVVGVDPLQNPDGRARCVNSYYGGFGLFPRTDPNAAEHFDPWPGGRGNHYNFDLNRDWFPLTQPESGGKIAAFLRWRPQAVADLHEMWTDSRFFFPPPADPINPNTDDIVAGWWHELGRRIGRTFDENGWDYWVRETFDAFYPGYGEAFPAAHGSAGMTFEQAGAAGLACDRRDGTTHHFREGILHHFGASLTVIRACAEMRARLLEDTRRYFATVRATNQAYVFPASGPGKPAEAIAATLRAQGIEVSRLTEDVSTPATPYDGGEPADVNLPAGSVVVRMDQPEARAARAVLERETAIDAAWLAEQTRRLEEGVDAECYDHTAWSLPVAAGADPVLVETPLPLEVWSPVSVKAPEAPSYGFLVPADGMAALRSVSLLRAEGVRVHVAQRPLSAAGREHARGAVVVKRPDQPAPWTDVCDAVRRAAADSGVQPQALETAWTEEGMALGSDNVSLVTPNRVAVLYGEPCSSLSYGWMAHLFEQRLRYPFTPVWTRMVGDVDLRRYDVLVIPGGKAAEWTAALGDSLGRLKAWVEQGGTLIAIGGAAQALAKKGRDWTSCRIVRDLQQPEGADPAAKPEDEPPVPADRKPVRVAGAALRVMLDRHHWATLGFGEQSHVLCSSDLLLTPSLEGRNVATYAPEESLVKAGLVWERMRPVLPGKAYLVDETRGRGHVLLFAEDPNQRGYWDVTSRLFANAVLFAPGRAVER
jgi:putative intracellular protease/amidase